MYHHRTVPNCLTVLILLALLLSSALVFKPASASGDHLIVTNIGDDEVGSLREAIVEIQPGGTITFSPSLSGQTILLSSTLVIRKNMVINAGALNQPITVSGNDDVRVFFVDPGVTATLIHLDIIKGYSSEDSDAGSGGGIRNHGTLTVSHCSIRYNQSDWNGGGITNRGHLTLKNSVIAWNHAIFFGGGVQNMDTMLVTDSIFYGNTAGHSGGGIDNKLNGDIEIINSTLENNSSEIHGGGINNDVGSLTLTNSTLSNNQSNNTGGGILNGSNGTTFVTNSTFYENHARWGGGIGNRGNLTYINTIIAGSVGGDDCTSDFGTIHLDSTHNLVQDGSCFVATNLSGDPKLGPLADNGGPTLTHGLLPGSPAIDAGSMAYCPNTDQRGVSRPQDGNGDGVPVCDIGAFEFNPAMDGLTFIYLPLILH